MEIGERMLADYQRVEQAIVFLAEHHTEQPRLEDIAAGANLSPFHFQRLFTRWAGISPKRFLQALTLSHAKQVLSASRSVLDAAYEAGLSGPSRLHDVFVTYEAMTPGEFKRGAAGLSIDHGLHPTPFGRCLIAATERGICALQFVGDGEEPAALDALAARWPGAALRREDRRTGDLARRAFAPAAPQSVAQRGEPAGRQRGEPAGAPPRLWLRGTPFQLKVWEALLSVPEGALTSYREIARRVGSPGAARAVGRAVAENPVAYLIPCHRVIRNTGAVGEYRWGAARKRAILAWEAGRARAV